MFLFDVLLVEERELVDDDGSKNFQSSLSVLLYIHLKIAYISGGSMYIFPGHILTYMYL